MSRLAVMSDDFPEAAQRHYDDADVLAAASRYDGVAYHAGYVVECSLKSVILHDRSYLSASSTTNSVELEKWHKKLRSKPYGHDLTQLANVVIGTEGARYEIALSATSAVMNWSETLRYSASGTVINSDALDYLADAHVALGAIVQMKLDGVL